MTGPNPHAAQLRQAQDRKQLATVAPALLTDDQAAEFLGVSCRKFHELRGQPWWTVKAVVLGPRLLRWPAAELAQAIATMPRQEAAGDEPAHLRRAKIDAMKARGVSN